MVDWHPCILKIKGSTQGFIADAEGYAAIYLHEEANKKALVRRYQKTPLPRRFDILCFHKLYPIPEEVLKSGFSHEGYDWEMKHWGCRWGAINTSLSIQPNHILYKFSCYGTPVQWVDKVARDYAWLEFCLMNDSVTKWKDGERQFGPMSK